MLTIEQLDRCYCTGCLACWACCPTKCISIEVSQEGFLYPKIDKERCISCGKCASVCELTKASTFHNDIKVFAAQIIDYERLSKSTSGGIAALIAEDFIERGGIVYGCIYDEDLHVIHARIEDEKELGCLNGSKYVQSDFFRVYNTLIADCISGKPVVIFGTPCQIAACRKFVGSDFDNLLLVDVICHGVASPKLFGDYLEWMSQKIGEKVIYYNFRDKKHFGWGTNYIAKGISKESYGRFIKDPYYFAYIYGHNYRESCYLCPYADINRIGDVSLGDYWGLERKIADKFNVGLGVSAVLVNTKKGEDEFARIKSKMNYVQTSKENVLRKNTNLLHATLRPVIRDNFYTMYNKKGIKAIIKNMYCSSKYYENIIRSLIPKIIKRMIKRLMGSDS